VGGPTTFEEIAAPSGVNFSIDSSPTVNKNQIETMVAGVALIDYDGDGYQDIFFVNGAAIPSLKKEGPQYKNRLFQNNRDGTFTDVTDKAAVGGDGFDMGAAVGDFDNDGRPDLYVVGVTKNHLYHNNGDGTFTDVTDKAGVSGGVRDGKKMWSVSAAWVDYNNDGSLDLFVSNYVKWEVNKDPGGLVANVRNYCSPLLYDPLPNTLYRNNGDGTFTDVSVETGIAEHLRRPWISSWRTTIVQTCFSTISEGNVSRKLPCPHGWLITPAAKRFPEWEPISATLTTTAVLTSGLRRCPLRCFRFS